MLTQIVGKHNINLVRSWMRTAACFGATGGLGFLYFTDWKLILQYMPIYNAKFKEDDQ